MDQSLVEMAKKKASPKRKSSHQKNQPLKVVYISNPMRVYASASEFRALVQELTGRDADFPDPTKFPSPSMIDDRETNLQKKHDDDDELLLDLAAMEDSSSDDFLTSSYESLEDILTRGYDGELGGYL